MTLLAIAFDHSTPSISVFGLGKRFKRWIWNNLREKLNFGLGKRFKRWIWSDLREKLVCLNISILE